MIKQLIKKVLKKFLYEIKKIKEINVLIFNSKNKNNFEEYYEVCKR